MKKLFLCKLATLLFGVLAVGILARLHTVALHLHHGDMLGATLALLSAISGTQWIEYRKRTGTTLTRSIRPGNQLVSDVA